MGAEWPKTLTGGRNQSLVAGPILKEGVRVEVIPADLGRELYESLRGAEEFIAHDPTLNHDPDYKNPALARYEKEIGGE